MPKSKHRRKGQSRPRNTERAPRCFDCGNPMIPSELLFEGLDEPPVICPQEHVLHRKVYADCRWEPDEQVAGVFHPWTPCRDLNCTTCQPYCGCKDCKGFEDLVGGDY